MAAVQLFLDGRRTFGERPSNLKAVDVFACPGATPSGVRRLAPDEPFLHPIAEIARLPDRESVMLAALAYLIDTRSLIRHAGAGVRAGIHRHDAPPRPPAPFD